MDPYIEAKNGIPFFSVGSDRSGCDSMGPESLPTLIPQHNRALADMDLSSCHNFETPHNLP